MIDLHTHTIYSDGTWNVRKLLEEAQKINIEVLSITDHDSINAYKEIENFNYKETFKGELMTGIEFSTVYNGVYFHFLGYDFNYKKLEKFIKENYEDKKLDLKKEFNYMLNSCMKNGLNIGNLDKFEYKEGYDWPFNIIYDEIKKHEENKKYFKDEEWNDINLFYQLCITNKKFPMYVDFSMHYPTADIVANAIRKAGGKTFLAHVYKYHLDNTIEFLDLLKENNIIDGIEVYHSSFTDEQIKTLEKYCKDNNLLMSGGSDCHGDKKADRKIGIGYGNLNINKSILEEWN